MTPADYPVIIWGSAACRCCDHEIKKGDMLVACHICGGSISMPSPSGVANSDCAVTAGEKEELAAAVEQERAAIVAWLRAEAERNRWYPDEGTLLAAADSIEKGEHNK